MMFVLFSILLGLAVINYDGGLPSDPYGPEFWPGAETVFVFLKLFVLEYPCFGSIINYCYKRGQHMEDYNMNITSKNFAMIETVIIAFLQQSLLALICNGILCATSGFWWISYKVLLIDIWYTVF